MEAKAALYSIWWWTFLTVTMANWCWGAVTPNNWPAAILFGAIAIWGLGKGNAAERKVLEALESKES